ncbi:MAG: hypothetical protein PVJ40_00480 [Gammaproteobacteria bacterium]|jgi:hypothetical protein
MGASLTFAAAAFLFAGQALAAQSLSPDVIECFMKHQSVDEMAALRECNDGQVPFQYNPELNGFASHGWAMDLGSNLKELRANLGEPKGQSSRQVKNPYTGQVNQFWTLDYPGLHLELAVLGADASAEMLPVEVSVRAPDIPVQHGLAVGQAREDVIHALGPPTETAGENLIYRNLNDEVVFSLHDGTISAITWHLYFD